MQSYLVKYGPVYYGMVRALAHFSSLPQNPDFKQPSGRGLLKILWEKKKMLVTSIFIFSLNCF